METDELIKELGLKNLSIKDVEAVEEALNSDDAEVVLSLIDKLVAQSKKPIKKKRS